MPGPEVKWTQVSEANHQVDGNRVADISTPTARLLRTVTDDVTFDHNHSSGVPI